MLWVCQIREDARMVRKIMVRKAVFRETLNPNWSQRRHSEEACFPVLFCFPTLWVWLMQGSSLEKEPMSLFAKKKKMMMMMRRL